MPKSSTTTPPKLFAHLLFEINVNVEIVFFCGGPMLKPKFSHWKKRTSSRFFSVKISHSTLGPRRRNLTSSYQDRKLILLIEARDGVTQNVFTSARCEFCRSYVTNLKHPVTFCGVNVTNIGHSGTFFRRRSKRTFIYKYEHK